MAVIRARIDGAWVDVMGGAGGGTDEVWVGPDTPPDSATEVWYDTDEVNLADPDTARWNSAWGIIAKVADMNDAYALTPSQQAVTPGLTFTALAGRRYRIAYKSRAQGGTNTSINVWFAAPATPATPIFGDDYFSSPTTWGNGYFEHIHNGDGVTYTLCCAAKSSGGTPTIYSSQFYVEDVGPVSMASNPPAQPASAWTNLTLLNGWVADPNSVPMYRKVGDMVHVRGRADGTAVDGTTMTTMPVGYRPPQNVVVPAACVAGGAWASCSLYVEPSGNISSLASPAGRNHTSFGSFSYSVTP